MGKRMWIQEAIKRPGSLTEWFKKNRDRLRRKLGYDPITQKGDIRDKAITDTLRLHKEGKMKLSTTTVRRLNLAKTLKKLRPKKKSHSRKKKRKRKRKRRRRR